ncbi:hypothetical protein [Paenibacillus sp. GCM10028914]|uniref:hypothetical protein n=1 Tax=Paenibacillus sp. GCM10028914 TaxID=3273416 RepID=UPI003613B6AB
MKNITVIKKIALFVLTVLVIILATLLMNSQQQNKKYETYVSQEIVRTISDSITHLINAEKSVVKPFQNNQISIYEANLLSSSMYEFTRSIERLNNIAETVEGKNPVSSPMSLKAVEYHRYINQQILRTEIYYNDLRPTNNKALSLDSKEMEQLSQMKLDIEAWAAIFKTYFPVDEQGLTQEFMNNNEANFVKQETWKSFYRDIQTWNDI